MKEGVNVSDKGWIVLDRCITDNWIWDDKPFSRGQAWLDLVMRANHKDKKIQMGNEIICIERGSFVTSEAKLAESWGWSRSKVIRFLKLLESDNMIIKKANNRRTAITIVNYGVFNDFQNQSEQQMNIKRTTNEQQMNNRRTTDEQQMNTNNNVTMKQCNNGTMEQCNNNIIKPIPADAGEKQKKAKTTKGVERDVYYPNDELLNDAFKEYVQMRKTIKKPFATESAIDIAMIKLNKLSGGDSDIAIQILSESVMNSWQGLFPLKDNVNNQNPRKQQVTFSDIMNMDIGE